MFRNWFKLEPKYHTKTQVGENHIDKYILIQRDQTLMEGVNCTKIDKYMKQI